MGTSPHQLSEVWVAMLLSFGVPLMLDKDPESQNSQQTCLFEFKFEHHFKTIYVMLRNSHAPEDMKRSENNLWGSVLCSHHVGSRD